MGGERLSAGGGVYLPPVLAAIASAAGEDAAPAIARAYGGTRVLMPTAVGDNWLTELVGQEAAVAIIEALGPARRIDVPLGPDSAIANTRRALVRRFVELDDAGNSEAQIARALGVPGRWVRRRRADRRGHDDGQIDLFK